MNDAPEIPDQICERILGHFPSATELLVRMAAGEEIRSPCPHRVEHLVQRFTSQLVELSDEDVEQIRQFVVLTVGIAVEATQRETELRLLHALGMVDPPDTDET